MAVRIIIGRAGSGKTRRCLDGITAELQHEPLGKPIFWIVPRQATFISERMLTCESGLGGFCRARVLSFERLGEEILADCGGAAIPDVTPIGRQMILGYVLRKHQPDLAFFKDAARQPGLAARLDATFAEFECCGRDSADLAALLADLEPASRTSETHRVLRSKVADLKVIYDAYTAYLGQERLDQHRRLEQVLSCIDKSRLFAGGMVWIDGFGQFTEFERHVIARLGKACKSVEVTLTMDPASILLRDHHLRQDEMSLFHGVEETYRRLWITMANENVHVEEPVILKDLHRFKSRSIATVERDFWPRRSVTSDDATGIELIEAENRRAEVDTVASRIRDLLRDGYRLRDIAVIARDLDSYHAIISASFAEHGIRCFIDRQRAVAHHPLLQFVRAALSIAQNDFPNDAVLTLIKSGLSGLTDEEADDLENYVIEHRIDGPAWRMAEPWMFQRKTLAREDEESAANVKAERAEILRRTLLKALLPLQALGRETDLTIKRLVLAVFDLFEQFGVRMKLLSWMQSANAAGDLVARDEHEQVWARLVDLLDQMVALIGNEPATLDDFVLIYESAMEQFHLALTPPTVDEVLVGQVDRTRAPNVRAVFVLGMNEGVFPRSPVEDSVLSDMERREMREKLIDVDPDTRRRLLEENLLGYIALTRASERLTLTRSLSDDAGRPLAESAYWSRLREIFPSLVPVTWTGDEMGTPRQLVTEVMEWVRNKGIGYGVEGLGTQAKHSTLHPKPDTLSALYNWLAGYPTNGDAIDTARFFGWKALAYTNDAALSRDIAGKLFVSPLQASVTRIESFATCPYKHFAQFGLKLLRREEKEITPMDMGNIFHRVLERVAIDMMADGKGWKDLPVADRSRLIDKYAKQAAKSLRGEIFLSNKRNEYLLDHIRRTLEHVAAAQQAVAERGNFVTKHVELGFGGKKSSLPAFEVTTPKGRRVLLQGKIDRVDVVNGTFGVTVIDYKLRKTSFFIDEVYYRISLQLLTYLVVLKESGATLLNQQLTPAAAFYVKLIRDIESVKHPGDVAAKPPVPLRVKPRGVFRGDFYPELETPLPAGYSQVYAARINKDGQFGNRGASDVADPHEFTALLDRAKTAIAQIVDQIIDGQIGIHPFLRGGRTPCTWCDFKSVCRFERGINDYNVLDKMSREDALALLVSEGGHG